MEEIPQTIPIIISVMFAIYINNVYSVSVFLCAVPLGWFACVLAGYVGEVQL